jgi:hypothetical protein
MSHVQAELLIEDYLRRLDAAASVLPPHRRRDLVAEIGEHIDDALHAEGSRAEAAVRNVLDRLGPPEEIAAAAAESTPGRPPGLPYPAAGPRRAGAVETAALVSFGVGVVSFGLGSLVGLALVWASRLWTRRDKLVATPWWWESAPRAGPGRANP